MAITAVIADDGEQLAVAVESRVEGAVRVVAGQREVVVRGGSRLLRRSILGYGPGVEVVLGRELGDVTTLRDPDVMSQLEGKIKERGDEE